MIYDFRDLDDRKNASPTKKKQQGYIENHYQHMMPIISQSKISQNKKAAQKNVLQKCFRSFVKQKMFGILVNRYGDRHSLKTSYKKCNSLDYLEQKQAKINQIEKIRINKTFLTGKEGETFRNKLSEQKLSLQKYNWQMQQNRFITPSHKIKLHSISGNIVQRSNKQLSKSINIKKQVLTSREQALSFNDQKPVSKKVIPLNSEQKNETLINLRQVKRYQYTAKASQIQHALNTDLSFLSSVEIPERIFIDELQNKTVFPLVKKSEKSVQKQKVKKSLFIQQLISVEVWLNITVQNSRLRQPPRGTSTGSKIILAILAYATMLLESKVLSRQLYIKHMKNSFQLLSSKFLKYFDTKFTDGMTRKQYANEINQSLLKASSRVWGFMCFQFFDIDKNGIIDSGDLFNLYKMLEMDIPQKFIDLKANNGFETFDSRQQSCRQFLIKQINILNEKVIQNKKDIYKANINQNQSYQMSVLTNKKQNYFELLEESFIKNHNAVSRDVQQVVNQDQLLKNPVQRKFAVNISEDLAVKFASIYRQSFLATQHNQETRIHRQKIQRLKQELKEQRKNRMIKNGGITYQQFLQNKFESNIRFYLIKLHGWQGLL